MQLPCWEHCCFVEKFDKVISYCSRLLVEALLSVINITLPHPPNVITTCRWTIVVFDVIGVHASYDHPTVVRFGSHSTPKAGWPSPWSDCMDERCYSLRVLNVGVMRVIKVMTVSVEYIALTILVLVLLDILISDSNAQGWSPVSLSLVSVLFCTTTGPWLTANGLPTGRVKVYSQVICNSTYTIIITTKSLM